MASSITDSVLQIILPKRKAAPAGTGYTSTFNPTSTQTALSSPTYRNHLQDIFSNRVSQDSRELMKDLFKYDSDVSATLHAYLTVANTTPRFYVRNQKGELDLAGQQQLELLLGSFTRRNDYSTGFSFTDSLRQIAEELRYMVMLRGQVACELVFNKQLLPSEVRNIDPVTLEWFEASPGIYKPQQRPPGSNQPISLDIPNFFVKNYRQNPTEIYAESMFVSSINTVAARQQVINDLYRIMQKTGYPRIDVSVMEEVLRKNIPASIQNDERAITTWINARLQEVANQVSDLRPDAAFVHVDAIEAKIINEGGPSKSMDVESIIKVLNAQNQASLKTVATLIGRGESGVNTGTVEARIFSMSADALNGPIADLFSDMLTLAMRLTGYEGYVVCMFDKAEMRPETELEPQYSMRQARLQSDLSLGLITDDEYHMEMYGRVRPSSAPILQGTSFMQAQAGGNVDASKVSPNSDPLGRSLASPDSKSAKNPANTTSGNKGK